MFTVYLVDDEPWQVKSLLHSIKWEEYGAEVIGVQTNSLTAYDEIMAKNPMVVFTDVKMPVLDGLGLIEKLQKNKFKGVFAIVSGYAEYEYAQKALNYDVVGYCLKPTTKEDIVDVLIKAKQNYKDKKLLLDLKVERDADFENTTFNEILNYLKEHFEEEVTLQSISERFFINSSYLSKLFKNQLGINFTAYLSNLRLKRACLLLRESTMQVSEVAMSVGFSNYFYFARVFKKTYGMTPTEYKKKEK